MATTKDGREITFVEYDQDPTDWKGWFQGWVCHRIAAHVDGKEVGRLKIVYISPEVVDLITDEHDLLEARKREYMWNFAMVGWSGVDEEYQRQGIGAALYIHAAKWLAHHKGMRLHSDNPQPCALSVWRDLKAKGYPVLEVPAIRGEKLIYALDYRVELR